MNDIQPIDMELVRELKRRGRSWEAQELIRAFRDNCNKNIKQEKKEIKNLLVKIYLSQKPTYKRSKIKQKEYYQKHKERIIASQKKYVEKNRDKIRAYQRQRYKDKKGGGSKDV